MNFNSIIRVNGCQKQESLPVTWQETFNRKTQRLHQSTQNFGQISDLFLSHIAGKGLDEIESALPYLEKMLESERQITHDLEKQEPLFYKMNQVQEVAVDRIRRAKNENDEAFRKQQLAVSHHYLTYTAIEYQLSGFEGQSLALPMERIEQERQIYLWLKKEETKILADLPTFFSQSSENIKNRLKAYQEQSYLAHNTYITQLAQATFAAEIDQVKIERLDVIKELYREINALYLYTISQQIELEALSIECQLEAHVDALNLVFLFRFEHLKSIENKLILLTSKGNHELELLMNFQKMKLKEEGQKLDQIISLNSLDKKKGDQLFNRIRIKNEFERQKARDLFDISLERNQVKSDFERIQLCYEEEVKRIKLQLAPFRR